ncbi:TetR/AcrR family transcriptional regulator [Mucilaginibacter sp. E4BP6]|uniref:TetR/AcrR family transcriptional regulator n=1 Tax=Mucilaginibacter sp. E4BP6 TaxID=2723089 RepID=UPI0015CE77F0|nr:TetR/AcrR family transcriptional regulator [Mucilaginibacter sp. E4BP6]NYE67035.1 AcrR family transcriptional regulator [Mucilaginibacter sp. E4BP6]
MKKRSIRDAIVNTSIRLFYKQGYSNTGINQIIEEADISKSSLYQHFRAKEDLLIVYLEVTGKDTLNGLKEAADKYTIPKDKILSIFEYLERLVQQNEFYGCHFLNMVYELPEDAVKIKEIVKKQKDTVRALFEEILAPLHRAGLADEIYTLFEGALIANKVHNDHWPIVTAKNVIRKII